MTGAFWMILCLVGFWGLGCSIALSTVGSSLLSRPARGIGFMVARAELIGLSWTLGIAATSYLQFVWSFVGGHLGRVCSLTLAVGGLLLGLLAMRRAQRSLTATPSQEDHPEPILRRAKGDDHSTDDAFLARVCSLIVIGLVAIAFVQTLLSPQKFWDERAYYGLKAIVLFQDRSIDSADLTHADFVQGHPRYPLLIPLAEQHVYALLGHVDDRLSKIIFPLMFTGLVFTFAGVLMRHLPRGTAWLGAVLVATTPVLMPDDYGFLTGQADAPVACFEGVALLYLWDWLTSARNGMASTSRSSVILAAVFGAMVAFTKDEGISHGLIRTSAFSCAALFGMIFHRRTQKTEGDAGKRLSMRALIMAATALVVVPVLILTPWFRHRRQLPMTGEMNYFGRLSISSLWHGLPTLKWAIPHLIERMFGEATMWGLQWWFVAVTLVLFPIRALRPAQLFLLMTLAVDIAALLLAGMIAPITLEEHIGGSSHRFLMQLAPGAVLFSIGQIWVREPALNAA
ncbi:MAG: hypothetical protein JWP89_501 [Schlesneria sp.]|nr:hypothetical protein [Schlesneria sp.]